MKVLVSTSAFAQYNTKPLDLLKDSGFQVILNPHGRKLTEDEIISLAKDCTCIVAGVENYSKRVFENLPKLKAISRVGVGLDSIDLAEAKKRSISIFSTPNSHVQPVAELTIGFILDLLRNISLSSKKVHSGLWKKEDGLLLSGKTVGIIGLGKIGKKVAEILKAFGAQIIAVELYPDKNWLSKNKIKICEIDYLVENSDIITLHIPKTEKSVNILNRERLSCMKKGAYLVNTSRGGLVDEIALYDLLKTGYVLGAALDVFENEPYNGPLKNLDNVILTPHIGAYAQEARISMEIEAVQNLLNYLGDKR